jgi:glycosyltransferase involved in cell wall biosynthesis
VRVLHIITGLDVGGAELQVRMLLQHSRHDGEVLALYNPATVAGMIRADGGRVRDLGMRRNTQLSAVLRLARLLWSERFDVVHVHLFRACVYGRAAAWLARTPVVVTSEHSIGETHIERRRMTLGVRALYLATDLFSDVSVAVSETVRQRLVKWGVRVRKIVTIPNGLEFGELAFDPDKRSEARHHLGIAQDAFVLGVMGRLDAAKRIDIAIRAAAPLLGETRKMLIVGQGADRERLEGIAAEAGVAGHVIFAGYQADGVAMLSALDLYVSTSAQETFGLSVLEALANGMPALFTACPALDGIVTDRARQVSDTVPELCDEIAKEIEAWPRPRQSVPEVIDRYGIASVAARIDDLYESLARRKRLLRREIRGARNRERDHANAQ